MGGFVFDTTSTVCTGMVVSFLLRKDKIVFFGTILVGITTITNFQCKCFVKSLSKILLLTEKKNLHKILLLYVNKN